MCPEGYPLGSTPAQSQRNFALFMLTKIFLIFPVIMINFSREN